MLCINQVKTCICNKQIQSYEPSSLANIKLHSGRLRMFGINQPSLATCQPRSADTIFCSKHMDCHEKHPETKYTNIHCHMLPSNKRSQNQQRSSLRCCATWKKNKLSQCCATRADCYLFTEPESSGKRGGAGGTNFRCLGWKSRSLNEHLSSVSCALAVWWGPRLCIQRATLMHHLQHLQQQDQESLLLNLSISKQQGMRGSYEFALTRISNI